MYTSSLFIPEGWILMKSYMSYRITVIQNDKYDFILWVVQNPPSTSLVANLGCFDSSTDVRVFTFLGS